MKLLVFTYAPAGLGHLRVTDALMDSKPKNYRYILLGSSDKLITKIHRFSSTNPIGKAIFVASQYGVLEDFVTGIYRLFLTLFHKRIYHQFVDIIKRQKDISEIWVVATHFGLAHQIGKIKDRLISETGVKIKLFVQVTDDTSQHIWCVRNADLTFVPSENTKKSLKKYSIRKGMNLEFSVIPYPLSSVFTKVLDSNEDKRDVTFKSTDNDINISIPISGAAVGLEYISNLVKLLSSESTRFKFYVVVKKAVYTKEFISVISKYPNVNMIIGHDDPEMISVYEDLFNKKLIHLEITKPSEQAFKAILSPNMVGGPSMFFCAPMGRQEFDNVHFLKRHRLVPPCKGSVPRAICLPNSPLLAADLILWCLNSGLLLKMSSKFEFSEKSIKSGEIGALGAEKFWFTVTSMFA